MKTMMNKKVRGSISVLLIIILVPMMGLAGIIVDVSRLELSKAMVSSAGDLTANTALTYYEKTLKDVYGLYAVDTKKIKGDVKDYFEKSLIANEGKEQSGYGQAIKFEISDNDAVSIKGIADTSLANAEILKTQIVEFMKYRAPLHGALSIIDGIKSLKKISEQSKVMKAQAAVNEAIGDFNEKCKTAYTNIKDMIDNASFENVKWKDKILEGKIEETYKEINDYQSLKDVKFGKIDVTFEVQCPTDNKTDSVLMNIAINANVDVDIKELLGKCKVEPVDKKKINPSTVYTLTKSDGSDDVDNVNADRDELITTAEKLKQIDFNDEIGQDIGINIGKFISINIMQMNKNMAQQLITSTETVLNKYAEEFIKLDKINDEYYKNNSNNYKVYKKDDSDEYTDLFECYAGAMDNYLGCYMFYLQAKYEIEHFEDNIKDDIDDVKTGLENKINALGDEETTESIIGRIHLAAESVKDIKESLKDINNKNEEFKEMIDAYNGKDAADEFSESMSNEQQYNKKSFDVNEIDNLYNYLNGLETKYETLRDDIKKITYCEKPIYEIKNYSEAESAYNAKPKSTNECVYIPDNLGKEYKQGYDEKISVDKNTYKFWDYLDRTFAVKSEDNAAQEENKTNVQDQIDATKTDMSGALSSNAVDTQIQDENLPSKNEKISDGEEKTFSSESLDSVEVSNKKYKNISSVIESIGNVVSTFFSVSNITKLLKNARDNLYVADYIVNMFSYDTIENDNGGETPQTMSGFDISEDNNVMYRGEIEYVLFGKSSTVENINTAKMYIFGIRFLCNSIYAYTSGEIKAMTMPPAVAIQAATGGIVPYKIPQIIFQALLALGESAVDMVDMSNGEKVVLLKSKSTWNLSMNGAIDIAKDYATQAATNVIQWGTNKVNKKVTGAFNNLVDNVGTTVKIKGTELVDDFEVSMRDLLNEQLCNISLEFSDTIASEVSNKLYSMNSSIESMTADSLLKSAKVRVQEYIDNNTEGKIKNILNEINASDVLYKFAKKSFEVQIDSKLNELKAKTASTTDTVNKISDIVSNGIVNNINKIFDGKADEIKNGLNNIVDEYSNSVKNIVGDKMDEVTEVVSDKLIEVSNNAIENAAGKLMSKLGTGDNLTNMSQVGKNSLLKFGYKDYLEMILLLKLTISNEQTLLRVADLVQINVKKQTGKKDYRLDSLYTYVSITADVSLDTLIISNNWINSVTGQTMDSFNIRYEGLRGY